MKIKDNYQIVNIMNSDVLLDTTNVNGGIIKLNETSKIIVEGLINNKSKEDIINLLFDNYDIDKETLSKDFDKLIESLKKANAIDD